MVVITQFVDFHSYIIINAVINTNLINENFLKSAIVQQAMACYRGLKAVWETGNIFSKTLFGKREYEC